MPFSEGGNWVLRSMMLSISIWYTIDSPMFLFFTTIESLFEDISELPPQRSGLLPRFTFDYSKNRMVQID